MSCKHVFILFHFHVLQYCTYFVLKSVSLPSKCSDYTEVHPLWITFCLYFPISKISFNFVLTLLMILWVFKINRNLLWSWITYFCNFTITVAFTELQYFLKIKSLTSHPTRIALKLPSYSVTSIHWNGCLICSSRTLHQYRNVTINCMHHNFQRKASE